MGKRQHQKDKMYLTYTEWTTLYGGKKSGVPATDDVTFKRLPFDHCCLSLVEFEHPYCDKKGNVFELQMIVDFIKHFKINPVTGEPMDIKSLIKLNFYKNSEDAYHCPVLFKPFTPNSHIVAVSSTGNVFSYEAIEQLNIKTKNWKDLINDKPFERTDLIVIQDPKQLEKFNLSTFYHIRKNIRVETEEDKALKKDPTARLKTVSMETKDTLDELNRTYKAAEVVEQVEESADKFNAAHYTTGKVAASFTSTAMVPKTKYEAAIIHEDLVRYERVKKKGYVRLVTNLGSLNLELFCDVVPKTCENFLKHCQNGYYDGTKFHRSIKNFMVQGGDPTGTGLGGTSIWNTKFEDEFKPNLTHTGRGVLSMANSGPNTNGSQFFITYRSCRHLDGKHTIFGKIVGGLDVLNEIEKIEVDNRDRPIENITIRKCQVFVDPFAEADEQLIQEREDEVKNIQAQANEKMQKKTPRGPLKVFRQGVGKYINTTPEPSEKPENIEEIPKKKKKDVSYGFNNFNSW